MKKALDLVDKNRKQGEKIQMFDSSYFILDKIHFEDDFMQKHFNQFLSVLRRQQIWL